MISFLMRSYTLTGTFLISSVSAFMHSRIPPMSDTTESQNLVGPLYASSMDFICVLRRPDVTWSSLLFVTWYSDKSRLSLFSVIPKSDVIFVVLCLIAFSASTGIFSSVTSSVASSKWIYLHRSSILGHCSLHYWTAAGVLILCIGARWNSQFSIFHAWNLVWVQPPLSYGM